MPPKRTQTAKKATLPKISLPVNTSVSKDESTQNVISNAIESVSNKPNSITNAWDKARSESSKTNRVNPRILIFGDKWTGKTTIAESAGDISSFSIGNFVFPNFFPVRLIDCERNAAKIIANKTFSDQYTDGKILIIDPYEDENGKYISDPIKRVQSVRSLIMMCREYNDGCLVIDGFDRIEIDCMHFIYRHFGMYEKDDGTIWKKEKKYKNNRGEWETDPEKPVGGITQKLYGPRTTNVHKIYDIVKSLSIPVIIISHETQKYDPLTDEPTGVVVSNLRPFIENDVDIIAYIENVKEQIQVLENGSPVIKDVVNRKITIVKNRFQKEKSPKQISINGECFTMKDIFSAIEKEYL